MQKIINTCVHDNKWLWTKVTKQLASRIELSIPEQVNYESKEQINKKSRNQVFQNQSIFLWVQNVS